MIRAASVVAISRKLLLTSIASLGLPGVQAAPAVSDAVPQDDLVDYTEAREICTHRSATRNAYFGDLHIHTSFSYDALPFGTRTSPTDAYRFAQGESLGVPPYDENGAPQQHMRLRQPLDFAAVTDHAEFFGELALCSDSASSVYDEEICRQLRSGGGAGMFPLIKPLLAEDPARLPEICGADGSACRDAAPSLWQATQAMAEDAYDRSSRCRFTTFVAYEYTGTPDANNYHRNVIFRNDRVPERAITYIEAPRDRDLWTQLSMHCLDGVPGCDVLAIPHNSNLSSGAMFPSYAGAFESPQTARRAAELRNAMEPVMEIFQHKGNSECFNGLPGILGPPDELCDVEQVLRLGPRKDTSGERHTVRYCEKGEIGRRGFSRIGCISRNDFFRSVLLTGLEDSAAIGVVSYKLGAIGSTDTHISAAGATDERQWRGHLVAEAALQDRLGESPTVPRQLEANPGGLAGIWAVENSRDALFEALRRREVFGTTGTRIRVRLFGGWDIATDACAARDIAGYGYARGVPMGSELPTRRAGAKPGFLVAATSDPDGARLQKLQLIKGWMDAGGELRFELFDVAGDPEGEGELDLETGLWSGAGSSSLCAVFEDAEFDPSEPAYYYLRAVEVPTLRWNQAQCVAVPAAQRPAACENDAPQSVQELAWTSPIWYVADEAQ